MPRLNNLRVCKNCVMLPWRQIVVMNNIGLIFDNGFNVGLTLIVSIETCKEV